MDSPQILQFVDEAVCAKTGKHLNNLQRKIIAGILNRKKYTDVAETYDYSSQHVKKASHELLQMLSEVFGEPVRKSNLESVIERHINQNITTLGNYNTFQNSYINNCPNPSTPTPTQSQQESPDLQETSKNKANIETIEKLRQFGLSDEQIAEALDIPLEQVKQVDLEE